MDYLEGFLIGPVWSDTDYRSRRHYHAHVLLAAVMGAVFAMLLFLPEHVSKWMVVPWPLSLVLLIVLILTTPLLSSIYYKIPFFIRPFLLLFYAAEYVLLFFVLAHYFLPLIDINLEKFPSLLLARMDDHISRSLNRFSGSGRVIMTVAGVLIGALWIIAEGLVVVLILIALPLVAIALLKGVRQLLDMGLYELIDRFILRGNPADTDDIPWLGKVERELGTGATARVPSVRSVVPREKYTSDPVEMTADSPPAEDPEGQDDTEVTDMNRISADNIDTTAELDLSDSQSLCRDTLSDVPLRDNDSTDEISAQIEKKDS